MKYIYHIYYKYISADGSQTDSDFFYSTNERLETIREFEEIRASLAQGLDSNYIRIKSFTLVYEENK